jgi:hypothetical protein
MSQFTIKIEAPEIVNAILTLVSVLGKSPVRIQSIPTVAKEEVKITSQTEEVEIASEPTIQSDPLPEEITKGEPKVEKIKLEQIRTVLAGKDKVKVKALINEFGGSRLTDIDPDKYPQMMKKAEAL